MESQFEIESAIRSLQMQLDEGVDEWILPHLQSRFDEAQSAVDLKAKEANPVKPVSNPIPENKPIKDDTTEKASVDFSVFSSEEAIVEALFEALPTGLQSTLNAPLGSLGKAEAEVFVLVDPPHRDAVAEGTLEGDASFRLLRKSLQAIELDCDASLGKEPHAQVRFMPISPWRMPQDRKFTEGEAQIFKDALAAMIALGSYKAILLAGSNLAGLETGANQEASFDLPSFALVSPRVMLREPMLKRVHWNRLLEFRKALDEMMTI